ncbi:MAG TPA: winged helix-turn-helix domain-containing protein [Pyrinomonadaceae bacterium]|jgi:TolB-like protein/DNA-binding winged helix-turn-helix (wHTH) protein/Tfp pilus assembly protein PilF|nr:winged helix-turn-helix domain-containing protein [Pyrinomonadaceae bacterium]
MNGKPRRFYEFGPFRVDDAGRRLLLEGREVTLGGEGDGRGERLPAKAFDVLLFLLRRPGETLGRQEILDAVWAEVQVEQGRVDDNISTLRKFLGDRAKNSVYIETVPKGGYRFAADVREVVEEPVAVIERTRAHFRAQEESRGPDAPAPGPDERPLLQPPVAPRPAPRASKRMSRVLLAVGLAALAALAGAAYLYIARGGWGRGESAGEFRSLAILPLSQLGGGTAEDEYLGQGLADALITRLSNVRQVAVRPTSAVLKYGAAKPDLVAVAREQKVDAVLDGSFQRAGDRLRVTVQLVRASDGSPLWAEKFDEPFTDLFAVQDAISARVAEALELRLSGEEASRLARRPTESAEAQRLYLLGRFFWNKRSPDHFGRALDYYRQAVAADPDFALAHAGLAETYILLPNWTGANPDTAFTSAEAEARRALELDPRLPQAYTALASVKIYRDRDWDGAGEDYRRAIGLNPNYATARQWHSEWLMMTGHLPEAIAESEAAQRLDPLSPIITFEYAVMLYFARRHDEAAAQLQRALELEPGLYRARVFLSRIHFDRGEYEEAIRERALTFSRGEEAPARRLEADFLAAYRAGGPEGFLRRALLMRHDPAVPPEHRIGTWAESCARLGDRECTFEALREAERARHPIVDSMIVDPYFDFLRDDPRYAELMRRLNLRPWANAPRHP